MIHLSYTGDILLVGINYDKKSKEHQCIIEKLEKQRDVSYEKQEKNTGWY